MIIKNQNKNNTQPSYMGGSTARNVEGSTQKRQTNNGSSNCVSFPKSILFSTLSRIIPTFFQKL